VHEVSVMRLKAHSHCTRRLNQSSTKLPIAS